MGAAFDFDTLMEELLRVDGERLLAINRSRAADVPAGVDAAARRALGQLGKTAAAGRAAAGGVARRVVLPAVVGLAAVTAVTAGGLAASPALRDRAADALGFLSDTAPRRVQTRSPADYVIPSPGEDFTVQEEASGGTVVYKWFASDTKAVLVEIAGRLPEDAAVPEEAEPAAVEGGVGWYYELDAANYFRFTDGGAEILISFRNADRETLLAYAERFIEANR